MWAINIALLSRLLPGKSLGGEVEEMGSIPGESLSGRGIRARASALDPTLICQTQCPKSGRRAMA